MNKLVIIFALLSASVITSYGQDQWANEETCQGFEVINALHKDIKVEFNIDGCRKYTRIVKSGNTKFFCFRKFPHFKVSISTINNGSKKYLLEDSEIPYQNIQNDPDNGRVSIMVKNDIKIIPGMHIMTNAIFNVKADDFVAIPCF